MASIRYLIGHNNDGVKVNVVGLKEWSIRLPPPPLAGAWSAWAAPRVPEGALCSYFFMDRGPGPVHAGGKGPINAWCFGLLEARGGQQLALGKLQGRPLLAGELAVLALAQTPETARLLMHWWLEGGKGKDQREWARVCARMLQEVGGEGVWVAGDARRVLRQVNLAEDV